MKKSFITHGIEYKNLLDENNTKINPFLIRSNENAIKKLYTFFTNETKVALVTGFSGTGKKQLCEHVLSYTDKENIICKLVGTESTTLDDLHLFFYNELITKTNASKDKNLDSFDEIKDKIHYIFNNTPFIFTFVIYNYDNLKDIAKKEILSYINTFCNNDNVKVIIEAKTFDTEQYEIGMSYTKIILKAFSKELTETYLKDLGIKYTNQIYEQFYRYTRGYLTNVVLSIKYIINKSITLSDFLSYYASSGVTFDKFLAQSYYKIIIGTTKASFNLFIQLNHGLNTTALKEIGNFPENVLNTLKENYFLYEVEGMYYPSNFLKNALKDEIEDTVYRTKLTRYYTEQLSKNFKERDFIISRASLNNEITFCNNETLSVKIQNNKEDEIKDENKTNIEKKEKVKNNSIENTKTNITQTKKIEVKPLPPKQDFSKYSDEELYKLAEKTFKEYDYINTMKFLSEILIRNKNDVNSQLLLAKTYTKIKKWDYAIYYYEMLEKHYKETSDNSNQDLMIYEKANILYQKYKVIDAIQLLRQLMAKTQNKELIPKINLLLANISIMAKNNQLIKKYLQDGINTITDTTDNKTKMELYFKYALEVDNEGNISDAVEYYKKCIEINDSNDKYLALSYSNLADLFYDNNLYDEAKDCFEKAYNADKITNNHYGIYYSLIKIIELTPRTEKEFRITKMEEAMQEANGTRDNETIIEASIKLGDIYYDYTLPEKALSEYIGLYKAGKDYFEKENLNKIKGRITDIKAQIGDERFEELVPDYE